mmetsp:Transcript_26121/g.59188  ORF Transcript_26121/g.59188 Transcript_26121/m.59188 type:complete len:201 (-) Transcript_26121:818-1420(-)
MSGSDPSVARLGSRERLRSFRFSSRQSREDLSTSHSSRQSLIPRRLLLGPVRLMAAVPCMSSCCATRKSLLMQLSTNDFFDPRMFAMLHTPAATSSTTSCSLPPRRFLSMKLGLLRREASLSAQCPPSARTSLRRRRGSSRSFLSLFPPAPIPSSCTRFSISLPPISSTSSPAYKLLITLRQPQCLSPMTRSSSTRTSTG